MLKRLIKMTVLAASLLFGSVSSYAGTPDTYVLDSNNTIVLRGEVSEESVGKVALALMTTNSNEVNMFISSPGGSVIAGARLISIMRASKKKITCVVSFAASMAFVITQACDVRVVTDSSILMQHVASYGLSANREPNNQSMVKFFGDMTKELDQMQADRVGLSYTDFKAKTISDWWLYGKNAVTEKAADSVANATCSASLANQRIVENIDLVFIKLKAVFSACPLIEAPLEITVEVPEAFKGRTISRETSDALERAIENLNPRNAISRLQKTKE